MYTLKCMKYLEVNENTTYQNLCDVVNVMLRWKFITINVYIKKIANHLTLHLKTLQRKEKTKPQSKRWKEILFQ